VLFPAALLAVALAAPAESPADLIALGHAALARSHNSDALALFKAAMTDAERSGDRVMLARAYDGAAEAYAGLADWMTMLDYSQRAIDTNPHVDDRALCAAMARRGRAFLELRERETALDAYARAFEHGRRAGDEHCMAKVETERGLVHWRLEHDRVKALASYHAAIERSARNRDMTQLMLAWNSAGNIFRGDRSWAEAEHAYGEGLTIARRLGITHPFLLKNMGIVLRETGRRAEAERLLLEAVAAADRQGVGRVRWQGRLELGKFYRDSDPARAARSYEACLDILEAQSTNVLLDDYSAGAISASITISEDPYDLYIDLLLGRGDTATALVIAERARARAFLDTLASARDALAARVPAAYVRDEGELLRRISNAQAQLRATGLAPADEARVADEIRRSEDALAALRLRLAADHPAIAHARYPRAMALADIQRLVPPGGALLEYFLGADASTLWIVTPDSLQVVRLAPRRAIEEAVRPFVAAVSTPGAAYQTEARTLERLLFGSGAQTIAAARRLVVIPNGVLHYVPFEALADDSGRFLIERHAVSYAPSAASLAFLRSQPAPPAGGLIALGDPDIDAAGTASERGAAIDRVSLLKPLAYAARELDAVAAAFGGDVRILKRGEATELALADPRLEQAAILHIATHGLIDEDVPQRSGLALTMAAPASDGILQMREIYQLRMRAALVTLSACQTAIGKEVTGEGMVGFSRAFFYAGAHAVMASLWNVNDGSTADFMTRFYAALRQGQSIDDAARDGKLAFIASGTRLRHPYYWAPFIVTGDARVTVRPAGLRARWLIGSAAAIGIVTILAAAAVRRRRRPSPAPSELSAT
jgi:CHAT domain-containing protein